MIRLNDAIALLQKQVGKKYIFGHEVKLDDPDPQSFDCSELVEWYYKNCFGIVIPDGSYNQHDACYSVGDFRPFDLGFLRNAENKIFHVGIRYMEGKLIEAKGENYGVVETDAYKFEKYKSFAGWRRFKPLEGLYHA